MGSALTLSVSEFNWIVGHPTGVGELENWWLFRKSSNPSVEYKYHKEKDNVPFTIEYPILGHDVYTINYYFISHGGPTTS